MPTTQESAASLPARHYDTPVPGRLIVRLNNGDEHYATPEDLEKWGFVERHTAYRIFRQAMQVAVTFYGPHPPDTDLTDTKLNPLRYLAEQAIMYPDDLIALAAKAAANGDTWPEPDTDETAKSLANIGALESVLSHNSDEISELTGRPE